MSARAPARRDYQACSSLTRDGRDYSLMLRRHDDESEAKVMAMSEVEWGRWWNKMDQRKFQAGQSIDKDEAVAVVCRNENDRLLYNGRDGAVRPPLTSKETPEQAAARRVSVKLRPGASATEIKRYQKRAREVRYNANPNGAKRSDYERKIDRTYKKTEPDRKRAIARIRATPYGHFFPLLDKVPRPHSPHPCTSPLEAPQDEASQARAGTGEGGEGQRHGLRGRQGQSGRVPHQS
ncbi:hypothetical protein BDZ90DRAFT_194621 [Jaminaea rosea]|uniref:Uncharacterized protein n=1 Tax=Jaminaea rosea TaxID=1569628 RepID=A0A316UNQ9_9BASI|nr:hypothetical protein BDZ90DRAFT_194621 [Jaminaea rosea]PWN26909.1 hypothetical protein BDZ90DRAFT_194621 [Jaminaea rosea]